MKLQNLKMTPYLKGEIMRISKEFASAFEWPIEDSGWMIVDPLSGYLNFLGYQNKLSQIPASDGQRQVLIMTFNTGEVFVPGGAAINSPDAKNWLWID